MSKLKRFAAILVQLNAAAHHDVVWSFKLFLKGTTDLK